MITDAASHLTVTTAALIVCACTCLWSTHCASAAAAVRICYLSALPGALLLLLRLPSARCPRQQECGSDWPDKHPQQLHIV